MMKPRSPFIPFGHRLTHSVTPVHPENRCIQRPGWTGLLIDSYRRLLITPRDKERDKE